MIRVTIWNEFCHEQSDAAAKAVYPNGIHNAIADFLRAEPDMEVRTATLQEPEHGLTEEVLENTDVLLWWGHCMHAAVSDEVANRVCAHIQRGMGFIPLHSAHNSKPFHRILGTICNVSWRDVDRERVWCTTPGHPIAQGIPAHFELESEEMYGEPFGIPQPDETVFIGWFAGGEVFRSGVTFTRNNGKIFYFQPGHETFPTYYNPVVQQIIKNAIRWAKPVLRIAAFECPHVPVSLESQRKG